jgi:hypothetical protein
MASNNQAPRKQKPLENYTNVLSSLRRDGLEAATEEKHIKLPDEQRGEWGENKNGEKENK